MVILSKFEFVSSMDHSAGTTLKYDRLFEAYDKYRYRYIPLGSSIVNYNLRAT